MCFQPSSLRVLLTHPQAEHRYAQCTQSVEAAQQALQDMAAGFALEDATSRRSSVAPPSPLVLAGVCTILFLAALHCCWHIFVLCGNVLHQMAPCHPSLPLYPYAPCCPSSHRNALQGFHSDMFRSC